MTIEEQLAALTTRIEKLEALVAKKKAARPARPESERRADSIELTDKFRMLMDRIWTIWPERDIPQVFVPARRAVAEALGRGALAVELVQAAERYAEHCQKNGTEPRYVMTIRRFYADDATWRKFAQVTVYGLTREQWIASGQDVEKWDHLAAAEGGQDDWLMYQGAQA